MFYCEDRIAGKFHHSITITALIVLALALLTQLPAGWSMLFLADVTGRCGDGGNSLEQKPGLDGYVPRGRKASTGGCVVLGPECP